MFTHTISLPWYWRWIGRFISLKFCLRLSAQDKKACVVTVSAKDDSESSEALIIHVAAGDEMPLSLYFPPETLTLVLTSEHDFTCKLGLTHVELVKQALSLHQLTGFSLAALEDYWRKVDTLGGKLWVGRALSLRKSRSTG